MSIRARRLRPWLYFAALFGSQLVALVIVILLWEMFPGLRHWFRSPWGAFSISVLGGLAAFLVVVCYAYRKGRLSFLSILEIQSIQKGISYLTLVAGFVLGLTGVLLTRVDRAALAGRYLITQPFVYQPGPERYLVVILLLVGPVFEEITMRGFLYRVFRESYGLTLSISAIVFATTLTHWSVMTASLWMFGLLAALQITLCLILEKTHNLWNCIACHFVYNATITSAWLLEISG
jgi:membrane protease YdiL (CAAX protease family)